MSIRENNMRSLLFQCLSIWLLGGIVLWLTELLFVLIGLPQSWDYKFLRDGMSVVDAMALTLLPEKISVAFLVFFLMSLIGGTICAGLIYMTFRRSTETETTSLTISIFLTGSFFVLSSFWLNVMYFPEGFGTTAILLNAVLFFVCLVSVFFSFKLFISKKPSAFLPLFVALAFAIDCLIFGELFLLRSFAVKISSIRGIVLSCGLLIACFILAYAVRTLFRFKPLSTLTIHTINSSVFVTSLILVLLSGITVVLKQYRVLDASQMQEKLTHEKPNVILIVMDTTRADHFSCYGYKRNTTPRIDKIAAEGVLFKNVISPSSWTLPSHASMFTGLFPAEHGAGHVSSYLPEKFETLAEILKKEGYKTLAFSNNPWVSYYTGLSRKFDDFQSGWQEYEARYLYEAVYNRMLNLILTFRRSKSAIF